MPLTAVTKDADHAASETAHEFAKLIRDHVH